MSKFRNMAVGTKIGLGYGVITLILMGVVLSTIQQVKTMEAITKRVINLRTPTAHASLMMLNGINHSLASLRGWIILGEAKFQDERAMAWKDQIDPSLKELQRLSPAWADQENKTRLEAIEKEISVFRTYQKKIEAIAQTPENSPARKILFDEAEPLEKRMVSMISEMIKLEMKAKSTPQRKRLLEILANIETTTSLALERAEEFLLSGKQEFIQQSMEKWLNNTQKLQELKQNQDILTGKQWNDFKRVEIALGQFGPALKEIIRIRSGEEWNMANFWLGTQAAPAAFRIKELLNEMTQSQDQLLKNDVEEISNRTHFLVVILVALFFAAVLASGVLGSSITRSISQPIREISKFAHELALGQLRVRKLPVYSNNELGILSKSFNELLDRLQGKKPIEPKD